MQSDLRIESQGQQKDNVVRRACWLPLILTMAFLVGSVTGASAQRPDGHSGASRTGTGSDANTTIDAGCDIVEAYYDDLWSAIEDSSAFIHFLVSDHQFGDLSRSDAEAVIAEGENLITEINALDVPGAYTVGHEGIILFFQLNTDLARFYAIDSSIVPDLDALENSGAMILEGEVAIAESCPQEVETVGGYIMFDPGENTDDFDPDD